MVTIRDIAKRSNVTPGTVSMVLNGRGQFSAETRSRVEAAIAEMGYRRKSAGRPRRASKQSPAGIAVVYANRVAHGGVISEIAQSWIQAIREAAIEAHCHLSLVAGFQDATQDRVFQSALESQSIRGVILIGITADDGQGYLTQSLNRGVPTVVMNRIPLHGEFSYVAMDNFGSGKQVIDYLVRRGHKKIAMLRLPSSDRFVLDRLAGVEAGFAAHELNPTFTGVLGNDADEQQVRTICAEVVNSGATALYMMSGDALAARSIDAFQAMGLTVPRDMTIIGWDDEGCRSASGLIPSLIGYDKREMGVEATRMLLELMKQRFGIRSKGIVIETRIVEHDTSADAPLASGSRSNAVSSV